MALRAQGSCRVCFRVLEKADASAVAQAVFPVPQAGSQTPARGFSSPPSQQRPGSTMVAFQFQPVETQSGAVCVGLQYVQGMRLALPPTGEARGSRPPARLRERRFAGPDRGRPAPPTQGTHHATVTTCAPRPLPRRPRPLPARTATSRRTRTAPTTAASPTGPRWRVHGPRRPRPGRAPPPLT